MFRSEVFKVVVYLLGAILVGALLTPPLFWMGKGLVAGGSLEGKSFLGVDLHGELDRATLARYFNRGMLVGALLGIWPLIRWIGIRPKEFLQLEPNPNRIRHVLAGFFLAAAGLLLLGWVLVATGAFSTREPTSRLVSIISTAIVSGVAVAFLEEFFFRGCLLGLALRTWRPLLALGVTSAIFSAIHFLKPPDALHNELTTWTVDDVSWTAGFWMVGQIFWQFADPMFILAEFTTLFLVGWILGWVRLRTASLWMAIGLHAGWVFALKIYSPFTRNEGALPWVGKDLKSGLAALIVLALTGLILWFALRNRPIPGKDE